MLIVEIAERELTPRQLQVWYYLRIERWDVPTVAKALHIEEATVYVHLHNAEHRLSEHIHELDPTLEPVRLHVPLKQGARVWEKRDTTLAGAIRRIQKRLTKKFREEQANKE